MSLSSGRKESTRPIAVRRGVVHRALQWLVTNNHYYRALGNTINNTALAHLPPDGDLSHLLSITEECLPPDSPTAKANDSHNTNNTTAGNDSYNEHLPQSFVPVAIPSMTEQEAVQQSVQQHQATPVTLMWPSIEGMPLNEFTTEGYFMCAFPTLFPTGAGDFLGQRQVQVTISNHLMQYNDGRFARHPRFRFFALNTEMRHRALQTGRVYIRQHPDDGQLSLDELRDMVGRQGEAFSSRVLHYASSLRGTKQYWQRQRSRLLSMVDTLGLATIFFTVQQTSSGLRAGLTHML